MRNKMLSVTAALAGMLWLGEGSAKAVCQLYSVYGYTFWYDVETGLACDPNTPPPNPVYNHIVYLHGRSMRYWPSSAKIPAADLPAGWNQVSYSYNGDSRLYDATASSIVKNGLRDNCTGQHSCIVVTYSAGMNRFLYALNALNAEGTPPTNLLFVESMSSAAGGTPVARYTSKWWKKFLAKLFGGYADIDKDLHDTDWQGGKFAYLQNLAPAPVYHVGSGLRDQCVKFHILFFTVKLCGNKEMPGRMGDGAVPVYSQCGYADRGTYSSCCQAGWKYSNRDFESFGSCSYYQNHTQMLEQGFRVATNRILGRAYDIPNDGALIKDDFEYIPDCNAAYDDCDLAEADGTPQFYVYQYVENNEISYRGATCDGYSCAALSNGLQLGNLYCYSDYYIGYYCTFTKTEGGVTQNCLDFGGACYLSGQCANLYCY